VAEQVANEIIMLQRTIKRLGERNGDGKFTVRSPLALCSAHKCAAQRRMPCQWQHCCLPAAMAAPPAPFCGASSPSGTQPHLPAHSLAPPSFLQVTFGKLFDETQDIFEALGGTLKAAKKQGLISYTAMILLKGAHDKVPIILEKEAEEPAGAE
jgi:hypothetical protein